MSTLLQISLVALALPLLCFANYRPMCYLMGPHFITWDRKSFHYQSTCPAVAYYPCNPAALKDIGLPEDFSISIQEFSTYGLIFGYASDQTVMRNLIITIDGQQIRFGFDPVQVNGEFVSFPYYYPNKENAIFALEGRNYEDRVSSSNKKLRLKDGTVLALWGCWYFYLSPALSGNGNGNACGICGNNDRNRTNDFMLPNGALAADQDEFFKGWTRKGNGNAKNFGVKTCPSVGGKGHKKCPPGQLKQAAKICDELLNSDGPYKQCMTMFYGINTYMKAWYERHHEACVKLACQDTGAKLREAACMKLSEVANTCSHYSLYYDANGKYRRTSTPMQVDYRNVEAGKDAVCPISCDKNMHFDKCARVECIKSCENPNPSGWICKNDAYTYGCTDMCVCDEGLLWDGKRCVAPDQC